MMPAKRHVKMCLESGWSFYDLDGHHWEVLWMDPQALAKWAPFTKEKQMFGKQLSQYLGFQKVVLGLLAAVGLARLGLSLAGLPNTTVRWLSMNAVAWAGIFYYGIAVHTRGFGSYKQLLPLVSIQMLVQQVIAVLGILLAIAGLQNIYAAPEYSFQTQSQWVHALAHLTVGLIVPSLLGWGLASLVLLITRKVTRRPAVA